MQTKPIGERIIQTAKLSWNALTVSVRDEKVKYVTFKDV